MSNLQVIGITGVAGAGKDSIANMLTAQDNFLRVALADAMKAAFNDLSGVSGAFYKDLTPEFNYRVMCQILGTEVREDIGANLAWVHVLLMKLRYASHFHPVPRFRFVVPDIRYPFEPHVIGDRVRSWGGRFEVWRVTRPGQATIKESSHSSEKFAASLPVDRELVNDGTLADLANLVGIALSLSNPSQEFATGPKRPWTR